ncbi:D-inositol-3-phosphate glycosyltransferase [Kribbia dieselivorans]|uniref:D-inositol-3-phosphate glycosyltransferase n=1 Tax=Kribbia dieselivorans TaxID=331526 RepID=UPI0009F9C3FA|nr:D-inositol-3-phosphate glycosyltransferase [Kribbia dieselivorans]
MSSSPASATSPVDNRGIERLAMLSVHTSPLAQPGIGDAGGMNVYVLEAARALARRGVAVELFTRRTSAAQPDAHVLDDPLITVRHIEAGPYGGLRKEDLPGQLCAFTAGVMRAVAHAAEGHYDVVHAHYWLSGHVGWLAAERWQVPLVHTMHTMAKVKNRALAEGDTPDPVTREIGEEQVVQAADRLVANTDIEAAELIDLYGADPRKVVVVPPGVDLSTFSPGDRTAARSAVHVADDTILLLFVGRIQPLKAPDVLVRAVADLLQRRPEWRERVVVGVLGGASGTGLAAPHALSDLAVRLNVPVRFEPPTSRPMLAQWFRAADVVAVPSRSESFGLVAVEALASGTAVVAANVGGLPTAVGDAAVLVDGHDPAHWSRALESVIDAPARRADLVRRGLAHAATLGWDVTAQRLIDAYAQAVAERRARSGGGFVTGDDGPMAVPIPGPMPAY